MRLLRHCASALIALGCVACAGSEPTSALSDIEVTTDATNYVAQPIPGSAPYTRYSFRVIVRTTNRSLRSIGLSRCYPGSRTPTFGVRLHSDSASAYSAFDPVWGCVGGVPPLTIRPGATRIDTLFVEGPNAFSGVTGEPRGVADGLMSLHMASEQGGFESNRFLVSRSP